MAGPVRLSVDESGTDQWNWDRLAATRHIVEQHHAEISVEGAVGITAFTVRLPLIREPVELVES